MTIIWACRPESIFRQVAIPCAESGGQWITENNAESRRIHFKQGMKLYNQTDYVLMPVYSVETITAGRAPISVASCE